MLTLADVTANDVVYDLGSGDGRIPITAAKKFGARGVGIEIDPNLGFGIWDLGFGGSGLGIRALGPRRLCV